jgi:hypothetical protein
LAPSVAVFDSKRIHGDLEERERLEVRTRKKSIEPEEEEGWSRFCVPDLGVGGLVLLVQALETIGRAIPHIML